MPSRKNGYNPPVCTDERLRYINVECGECYECKRKRARQWRIRMSEEMRENPEAIYRDWENVNEIATKEVRLFMERLRQTNREKNPSNTG